MVDWIQIREHFAAALALSGRTQEQVAVDGGLTGQSAITRILHTGGTLGPKVGTVIRAINGLGVPLSRFFAEIEQGRAAKVPTRGRAETRQQRQQRDLLRRIAHLEQVVALPGRPSGKTGPPAVGVVAREDSVAHRRLSNEMLQLNDRIAGLPPDRQTKAMQAIWSLVGDEQETEATAPVPLTLPQRRRAR